HYRAIYSAKDKGFQDGAIPWLLPILLIMEGEGQIIRESVFGDLSLLIQNYVMYIIFNNLGHPKSM
ncbi:hypothetical protein ACJX0J_039871, partial [Zea mays]